MSYLIAEAAAFHYSREPPERLRQGHFRRREYCFASQLWLASRDTAGQASDAYAIDDYIDTHY